jgi:hypothetical protein
MRFIKKQRAAASGVLLRSGSGAGLGAASFLYMLAVDGCDRWRSTMRVTWLVPWLEKARDSGLGEASSRIKWRAKCLIVLTFGQPEFVRVREIQVTVFDPSR